MTGLCVKSKGSTQAMQRSTVGYATLPSGETWASSWSMCSRNSPAQASQNLSLYRPLAGPEPMKTYTAVPLPRYLAWQREQGMKAMLAPTSDVGASERAAAVNPAWCRSVLLGRPPLRSRPYMVRDRRATPLRTNPQTFVTTFVGFPQTFYGW